MRRWTSFTERTKTAAQAKAPAQTRDFAEHRAAPINVRKNTSDAVSDKGLKHAGILGLATMDSRRCSARASSGPKES